MKEELLRVLLYLHACKMFESAITCKSRCIWLTSSLKSKQLNRHTSTYAAANVNKSAHG